MRMLSLIPAFVSGHAHEIVELGLAVVLLGGALVILAAGIWWFRFRVFSVAALLSSGMAAILFRRLSHLSHHLGTVAWALCVLSLVCVLVAAWRTFVPKRRARVYKRGRRRKRRERSPLTKET